MFLTTEEIAKLTDLVRPSAQKRWLINNGYRFEVGASGQPKVLRTAVQSRLDEKATRKTKAPSFERI